MIGWREKSQSDWSRPGEKSSGEYQLADGPTARDYAKTRSRVPQRSFSRRSFSFATSGSQVKAQQHTALRRKAERRDMIESGEGGTPRNHERETKNGNEREKGRLREARRYTSRALMVVCPKGHLVPSNKRNKHKRKPTGERTQKRRSDTLPTDNAEGGKGA